MAVERSDDIDCEISKHLVPFDLASCHNKLLEQYEQLMKKEPNAAEQLPTTSSPMVVEGTVPSRSKSGKKKVTRNVRRPDWLPPDWFMWAERRDTGQVDKYFEDPTKTYTFKSKKYVLQYLSRQNEQALASAGLSSTGASASSSS